MAGIAGIISKNNTNIQLDAALSRMLGKLRFDSNQVSNKFESSTVCFCNVLPIAQTENINFIHDQENDVFCIIDGFAFVSEAEMGALNKDFYNPTNLSCHKHIPLLYKQYGSDIVNHLTGNYNIFIYDRLQNTSLLFNDRLGYLPLYLYQDDKVLLFASKIESILASGLMASIEVDQATIAEHLFFNYPITDHTYIRSITTLPDASVIRIKEQTVTNNRYWDISELFGLHPLNKRQSIEAIDSGLKVAIDKLFSISSKPINFSLTGGWDSRVVLSYLLPEHTNRFKSYSFGAPTAPDITIPQHIANTEGFDYTPFLLDQNYLDNHFLEEAKNTIMLSNGTRNYKRTHYVHTIKQIGQASPWLLSGIFGDEVFKVGKPQGGTVISKNAVDFIDSGFDVKEILQRFKESSLYNLFEEGQEDLINEFERRLLLIKHRFTRYKTSGEQYFAFRFTLNLRKFFGHEVNSYNDFVYCHSPFIDYDFLKKFATTKYMVSRFSFKKPSLKLKAQSTWLYYKLTKLNYKKLTEYPSSRAFSMKDSTTLFGFLKIVYSKFLTKKTKKNIDGFNTKTTDEKFYKMLIDSSFLKQQNVLTWKQNQSGINNLADYYSLLFWVSQIHEEYFTSMKIDKDGSNI